MSANLELAGDDVSDIYLNGICLGQEVGAGGATSFDGAAGIQSGINILAVQLLNNRHGGHPFPFCPGCDDDHPFPDCPGCDHIGLLFNLGAAHTDLRPFASAPGMVKDGQTVLFSVDDLALGGSRPYTYKFDFGDGAVIDYQSLANYSHLYASPGTYTAKVTARDSYDAPATAAPDRLLEDGGPAGSKRRRDGAPGHLR